MLSVLLAVIAGLASFTSSGDDTNRLRKIYSRPSSQWPKPWVNEGVKWTELGPLPESPLSPQLDSLQHLIELGKSLFFDPRLSGSGKISCATCHQPELHWTDGKEKSIGHEGAINKRNAPTIQNTWFYNRLFWDGRARDLQDQAFAPIVSESEMASEMPDVIHKLRNIKGYKELFKKAFGDEQINPDRMTEAIAAFEKTLVSRKSRFDEFLAGNKKALSNSELRGLHIFRTKAKCMNCHSGPLFTDNSFHNIGFSDSDKGYFNVSHQQEDIGKFKTPSLRDVMHTGPWMHDGKETNMAAIIEKFNTGSATPGVSSQVRSLKLTKKEKTDLIAFLQAISAPPADFQKPALPE